MNTQRRMDLPRRIEDEKEGSFVISWMGSKRSKTGDVC